MRFQAVQDIIRAAKAPPPQHALRRAFTLCLRNLRRAGGMSQETLALAAALDRGYMSGLERGKHSPTLETIYRLITALDITLAEFSEEYERCLRRALMQGGPEDENNFAE